MTTSEHQSAGVARALAVLDGAGEPGDVAAALTEALHDAAPVDVVALVMELEQRRAGAAEELADLQTRVAAAQQIASMGDYDWHISTDTNTWSDNLYRIYGHEPRSFNASYERFLGHIHPDDREMVVETHRQAYATGEPYRMVERIVRADGETRYLATNGQVIMGPDGAPERMRGTCVDITERVLAQRAHERSAVRLAEAQERRRQAAELHDDVVQGLTAALYAMELGDAPRARQHLDETLAEAKRIIGELVEPLTGDELAEGDLRRTTTP